MRVWGGGNGLRYSIYSSSSLGVGRDNLSLALETSLPSLNESIVLFPSVCKARQDSRNDSIAILASSSGPSESWSCPSSKKAKILDDGCPHFTKSSIDKFRVLLPSIFRRQVQRKNSFDLRIDLLHRECERGISVRGSFCFRFLFSHSSGSSLYTKTVV